MEDILVRALCKQFEGKTVLRDFSASFTAGQTTCVMGRSGCGKTTLLNILMGFLAPDAGQITGIPPCLSAVFQEDRLLDGFCARTNISFVCPQLSAQEIDRHLAAVGLTMDAAQPVSELSGGMRRRVAIVRAVLANGDLLLLDEPFKGLDESTRAMVAEYLRAETAGRTVIMVTHDPDEVALMGGRLLKMEPAESDTNTDPRSPA